MSYEEIITEIKSGLTGNAETDIKYLQGKISEYEGHEDRDTIAGICGQLIYDLLPEDLKEEFSSLNNALRLGIDEYSKAASQLINAGDSQGAESKLIEGIELLEGSDNYEEKDGVRFYDFRKPMEEAIFRTRYGFEKRIKIVPEPVVGIYRMYAELLYEKKEHEKAIEYLNKALRWNPYHQSTTIEYADHLRQLGRLEAFKQMLVDTFTFAYEPETLAGCYRRLGWYFSENKKWEPAAVCEILAGKYASGNEISDEEKKFILDNAGADFVIPEEKEFERISKENGFPCGASAEMIEIAKLSAAEFKELGNEAAFKYFDTIAAGLV